MCWTLHEKCPNTEFFLVRILPHSGWIRKDTFFKTYSFLSNNSFNIHSLRIFLFRILLICCKWNAAAVNSYNLYLIYYSVSLRIQPECGKIGTGKKKNNGRLEVTSQCISAIIISTCKKKSWNFLVCLYYEMNTYFEYWFRHCPQWKRFWIFWLGTRFEYNYQNMYCFCTNCF